MRDREAGRGVGRRREAAGKEVALYALSKGGVNGHVAMLP